MLILFFIFRFRFTVFVVHGLKFFCAFVGSYLTLGGMWKLSTINQAATKGVCVFDDVGRLYNECGGDRGHIRSGFSVKPKGRLYDLAGPTT